MFDLQLVVSNLDKQFFDFKIVISVHASFLQDLAAAQAADQNTTTDQQGDQVQADQATTTDQQPQGDQADQATTTEKPQADSAKAWHSIDTYWAARTSASHPQRSNKLLPDDE